MQRLALSTLQGLSAEMVICACLKGHGQIVATIHLFLMSRDRRVVDISNYGFWGRAFPKSDLEGWLSSIHSRYGYFNI